LVDSGARLETVPLRTLSGHTDWAECVTFSPDGTLVASGSGDALVRVWDAAGEQKLTLDCATRPWVPVDDWRGCVQSVAFSPDGGLLATASSDKKVRVWDVTTGQCLKVLKVRTAYSFHGAACATFSPDGTRLAAAWNDGSLRVWKVGSRQQWSWLTRRYLPLALGTPAEAVAEHVNWIAVSPDGRRLATADHGGTVRIRNSATGTLVHRLAGHGETVNTVAFSPDGHQLASGANDFAVMLWDPDTGTHLRTLGGHNGRVTAISYRPDGRLLAASSNEGTARIWDPASGQLRRLVKVDGRGNFMLAAAFSADGTRLATASYDDQVRIWDATGW
jgi:WD40 repeat protein